MPRVPRMASQTGYYHIIMRGAGKQILFESDDDRRAFLRLLARLSMEEQITLIAFCLMSNHVHLVLEDRSEALAKFMQRLGVAYARRFNELTGRVGPVFQGRYASIPIESDEQLLEAVRYVHQNPQRASVARTEEYPWSSYAEYLGGARLVDTRLVMSLLGSAESYVTFMSTSGRAYGVEVFRPARLTDEEATRIMKRVLDEGDVIALRDGAAAQRDAALRKLRDAGIGVRQAARLTGVGRYVISRAYRIELRE